MVGSIQLRITITIIVTTANHALGRLDCLPAMYNRIQWVLLSTNLLFELLLFLFGGQASGLQPPLFSELVQCFFREALAENLLHNELLAASLVSNANDDAGRDVASKTAREDDRRKSLGPDFVVDAPSRTTQRNLEHGMTVEEDNNRDEQSNGEGIVSVCLVRSVERV
jgi:hypothetical protein